MYTAIKQPGRYQAVRSARLAQVLEDRLNNGFADAEIGNVDTIGHYARIDGRRYSYLLETDSNGFLAYQIVAKVDIETVWGHIVEIVEGMEGDDN